MYIIDTNVLLDYPNVLEEFDDIMILTDVLKELDGLKLNVNTEVAFKARRAAVVLTRHYDEITWNSYYENDKMSVDDKIIAAAGSVHVIVTNDVYLKVKAKIKDVKTRGYKIEDDYTGIRTVEVELDENGYNDWLNYTYENETFPDKFKAYNNEFIFVVDKNKTEDNLLAIFQNKSGVAKSVHRDRIIKNKWIDTICPRNPEQKCLFQALYDDDISILYAGGQWGCGKSFILNNFALQQLEKGKIRKIVYIPNNALTENTMDIGALPGDVLEKVVGQIGPLIDLVGIDEINRMLGREELEVVPMSYIRGRSFTDSIVIVNEAQNLTEDHMKLLIGRCGKGSRIFFDGDFKQSDNFIFRNKNGLQLLLKLRKSEKFSKLFGTVRLNKIERSVTAQAASYLDEITGSI